jgi:hypothetical protein
VPILGPPSLAWALILGDACGVGLYNITYHFMLAYGFVQLMRNLTRVMVTHFNGGSDQLDFCYYFSARLLLLLFFFSFSNGTTLVATFQTILTYFCM